MREVRGPQPLLRSALHQFAAHGFEGASLQRIATDAGMSKSSVLYHFGSKEALLEAALRPAVDDLRPVVDLVAAAPQDLDRRSLLAVFVDYLVEHRLALAVLINQGQALAGHAVVDEADALVRVLATHLGPADDDDRDAVRFGVALAGATFMLVSADRWSPVPISSDALRSTLVDVLGELVLSGSAARPS